MGIHTLSYSIAHQSFDWIYIGMFQVRTKLSQHHFIHFEIHSKAGMWILTRYLSISRLFEKHHITSRYSLNMWKEMGTKLWAQKSKRRVLARSIAAATWHEGSAMSSNQISFTKVAYISLGVMVAVRHDPIYIYIYLRMSQTEAFEKYML